VRSCFASLIHLLSRPALPFHHETSTISPLSWFSPLSFFHIFFLSSDPLLLKSPRFFSSLPGNCHVLIIDFFCCPSPLPAAFLAQSIPLLCNRAQTAIALIDRNRRTSPCALGLDWFPRSYYFPLRLIMFSLRPDQLIAPIARTPSSFPHDFSPGSRRPSCT